MSLLISLFGAQCGLMLSESRTVATGNDGEFIPWAEDHPKHLRLNDNLLLGIAGEYHIGNRVREWARASAWTFDTLTQALKPFLRNLERTPKQTLEVHVLGFDGKRTRFAYCRSVDGFSGPYEFNAPSEGLGMITGGVSAIADEVKEAFPTVGLSCDSVTLKRSETRLRKIIKRLARSHVEINDRVTANYVGLGPFNTVSAFTGSNPLSQSGSTTTVSVAAFSIRWGFGTVTYNSGSVTVPSTGIKYYIYCDDPTYAGGSVIYHYTTDPNNLISDGRLYIGSITLSASGGGIPDPGSGGGGCAALEMYVGDRRLVGAVKVGDPLDTDAGRVPVQKIYFRRPAHCVRLRTDDGCGVIVSRTTPVTVQSGRSVLALDLEGETVTTDLGYSVCHVSDAGYHLVAFISVGGRSFAAGVDPHRRIYTHNFNKT